MTIKHPTKTGNVAPSIRRQSLLRSVIVAAIAIGVVSWLIMSVLGLLDIFSEQSNVGNGRGSDQ